jgi:hypothetical protein
MKQRTVLRFRDRETDEQIAVELRA